MATREDTSAAASPGGDELVMVRVFHAPREAVWRAWTEPERFMRWWGPKEFTAPACTIDLRVGGKYLACMRSPEGQDYWSTGVYREIVPEEKIVYTDHFADDKGNVVPPSHYGMGGQWAPELTVMVMFREDGKRTVMTLRHAGLPPEMLADCEAGWSGSFDKLADSLD
jgi:uncharacterized protein YndB with AHSA1/START domain